MQQLEVENVIVSLRNPKKFRMFEPFKFSNATFFRQIALQNLQRKNLGFSETVLIWEAGTSSGTFQTGLAVQEVNFFFTKTHIIRLFSNLQKTAC